MAFLPNQLMECWPVLARSSRILIEVALRRRLKRPNGRWLAPAVAVVSQTGSQTSASAVVVVVVSAVGRSAVSVEVSPRRGDGRDFNQGWPSDAAGHSGISDHQAKPGFRSPVGEGHLWRIHPNTCGFVVNPSLAQKPPQKTT